MSSEVINPYQPPVPPTEKRRRRPAWRQCRRFARFGGVVGICLPFVCGAMLIYSVWSQPPPPPGTGTSGTPAVVGFMIIVLGCPVGAAVATITGALIGAFFDMIECR